MLPLKAVILTGGLGTRLRPFTCGIPKPLLPVVNRPFIHYQLEELRRQGVREVVLATAYRPGDFRRALGDGRRLGLRLRYLREREPLGTGGGVRNALPYLGETTLILNGDALQRLDLRALLAKHRRSGAEVTLTLTPVEDPSRFGLVETDAEGRVLRFVEKPSPDEITCHTINAGAYLFERSAIELIPPGRPYSLERNLFPLLLERGRPLYAAVNRGYWLDFGTLDKYLQIHRDLLHGTAPFLPAGLRRRGTLLLAPGARLGRGVRHAGEGVAVLGRGAALADGVELAGAVCVGDGCRVGAGAALEECVVLAGTRIGAGARLSRCIVGRGCRIGAHAAVGPGRALGDGTVVSDFSQA